VFEKNREILDLLNLIPSENVIAVLDDGLVRFAMDVIRGMLRIRRLGIDATVDMEFFARTPAILAFLTGARRRVGLHRFTSEQPYRGDLLTHRVQHNPYLHTAMAYYLLVEALTCDERQMPLLKIRLPQIDLDPAKFVARTDERERVRETIDRIAGRHVEPPIVLLNPNASDMLPLRRWPTRRFVELARRVLTDHPEATIAITGGPSEEQAAMAMAQEISPQRAVCLAGETTLRELIVLYTLADVLVTNDSGPGHFASLTDLPTLVLFGPETPALFGPLGSNVQAMTANLACSPCVNALNHRFSPCRQNVCMQEISVDDVYARVQEILTRATPQRRALEVSLTIPQRRVVSRQTEVS